jgi:Fanconi anemia group M protein
MLSQEIEPRVYQEVIFNTGTTKNTLVVLPTGLGKTMIAAMVAAHRLKHYPKSKVLFLAPTKPLVQQHFSSLQKTLNLPTEEFVLFTGTVPPKKRQAQFADARFIFSTPQGLENDVISGRIKLDEISLVIFDEAHRAVGDYSYVYLAERYKNVPHARILGLTASPGTDTEKITEVCQNLSIEEIEVRQEADKDVAPYVQEVDMQWVEVPFPEALRKVQQELLKAYNTKLVQAHKFGYLKTPPGQVNKSVLLQTQGALHGEIARGNKEFELLKTISLLAEAMKLQHALELVETQGVYSLKSYLDQLQSQSRTSATKATKNLVLDPHFKAAVHLTEDLLENQTEHPKVKAVKKIILQNTHNQPNAKIILFTQYRDQAVNIQKSLNEIRISNEVFVGQAKKKTTGLSQKEQKEMLERFSDGEFQVLIATSVAEEGLDIPKVDLVMFYEPVPSAIRTVQRRGRTGRLEKGKVIVLVTKGTRDVGYRWVAHHKEKRMYRAITQVKKNMMLGDTKPQKTLSKYEKKKDAQEFTVIADHREKGSPVLKQLVELGVKLDLQQLAVGDFLLSDRCAVEYKNVRDFVDSIIDGRLLSQLKNMKQYSRPILILEGVEDLYSQRKIHPNAIRGMLATITVSYGYSIITTKSPQETAGMLYAIARREQLGTKDFQYHTGKPLSEGERLEYVIAAIPGIGAQLARPLLDDFKTIKNIANASVEDLQAVPGIGAKKAEQIFEMMRREYEE